jgi:multidrug transporter EmrE-like cation transporter
MADLLISLFMIAGIALSVGAVIMLRRSDGKKAGLMALAALLMFGNAVIWLAPTESGASLANPDGGSPQ